MKSIILVHGLRGAPIGLQAISKELKQSGYDVHAPAIPPFAGGGSLNSYTDTTYAEFIKNYIEQHHLKQPILIGHSMGSIIVAATAKLYPNLIDPKVILLSPIAKKPALPFRIVSPLAAIVPTDIVDYITTKFLFIPKDKKLFCSTMTLTHQCSHEHPPSRSNIAAAATKFSTNYCVSDFLPFADGQKFAIIAGKKDRLVGEKNIKQLANKLQAQLTLLDNTGHLHNYEQPQETAAAILKFIQ